MGNDFAVFVDLENFYAPEISEVKAVCDRHLGLGADGLIRITLQLDEDEDTSYFFMDYYNQDGSTAKMCGNGVRVTAHIIELSGLHDFAAEPTLPVMTRAGLKQVEKTVKPSGSTSAPVNTSGSMYRVNMGHFHLDTKTQHPVTNLNSNAGVSAVNTPQFKREVGMGMYVNMGNDHVVVENADFFDELSHEQIDVQNHRQSLDGLSLQTALDANIELIKVDVEAQTIQMRVQERGVGETLSCGTGICAVSVYAQHKYGVDAWQVEVPGGVAYTQIADGRISLEGPAKLVGKFSMVEDYLDVPAVQEMFSGGQNVR